MMRLLTVATSILISAFTLQVQAGASLNLSGGYLSSLLSMKSASDDFNATSEQGYIADGEIALSIGRIEAFGYGTVLSESFSVPKSITLRSADSLRVDAGGGLRIKTRGFWFYIKGGTHDINYADFVSASIYELKTMTLSMAIAGFKIYAKGSSSVISLEGEGGCPTSLSNLPNTTTRVNYSYFARGQVRLEFGRTFRLGVYAGARAEQYKAGTSYTKSESFGGLSLSIGSIEGRSNSFSTSSQSTSSSEGGGKLDYDPPPTARYPL